MSRRSILKDKEAELITLSDINMIAEGSDGLSVRLASPVQSNGYFLGYSGNTSYRNIASANKEYFLEKTYTEENVNPFGEEYDFYIRKYDGNLYLVRDYISLVNEDFSVTINKGLLKWTGSGTACYLGTNGSSTLTSTSVTTVILDENFHWEIIYNSQNILIYNKKNNVYIALTSGNAYAFSSSDTDAPMYYHTNGSKWQMAGTMHGGGSKYIVLRGGNIAVGSSGYYWEIYTMETTPDSNGTSVQWKYPIQMTFSNPSSAPSGILCGIKNNELFQIKQGSYYFAHGNTSGDGLKFSTTNNSDTVWMIVKN